MALTSFMAAATLLFGPQGHFSTEDAVQCAAVHDITLDAMRKAENVDAAIRRKIRDGLAMWEYEINASAPAFGDQSSVDRWREATTKQYADAKLTIYEDLDANAAPSARGDYLVKATTTCLQKIDVAYEGEEHPVVPFLREADAKAGVPVVSPVAASIDVVDNRGLR